MRFPHVCCDGKISDVQYDFDVVRWGSPNRNRVVRFKFLIPFNVDERRSGRRPIDGLTRSVARTTHSPCVVREKLISSINGSTTSTKTKEIRESENTVNFHIIELQNSEKFVFDNVCDKDHRCKELNDI